MNDFISVSDVSLLPCLPGVYHFYDTDKQLLYVGKALHLKKRVSSYFQQKQHTLKTTVMLRKVVWIRVLLCPSEADALVLEKQLVQHFQPRYNILLKDDKHFPYLKLTKEVFPKLEIVREKKKDGARYFGPYPSIGSTKALKRHLYDLFPIRDCKQAISIDTPEQKCILLDLERCLGPCVYKTIRSEYDAYVQSLTLFLQGKKKSLLKQLETRMHEAATNHHFELAAKFRDSLQQLRRLFSQEPLLTSTTETCLCFALISRSDLHYVSVQHYVDGHLRFQYGHYSQTYCDALDFMEQVAIDVLAELSHIPPLLLCQSDYTEILQELAFSLPATCRVLSPKKGAKAKLLAMAERNAEQALERIQLKPRKTSVLPQVQTQFRLKQLPRRIFGFDVSHLHGTGIVGSCVCFVDARPSKADYRHFKIKATIPHSNDPLCMKELLLRRFKGCLSKNEPLPHLVLVDGGKGQLSFACDALAELGLLEKVEILALAKRLEEIFVPGASSAIRLNHDDPALHLLQHVRDESHRFALRLQRKQRDLGR
ncbi:MAG: excinuclease ABC subunit UvrC [bacterium]